jgi:hypothetical protein
MFTFEAPPPTIVQLVVPLNRDGQAENGLAKAVPPKQRIIDLRVGDSLMFKAKAYDVIGAKPRHLENRLAVPQALVTTRFALGHPTALPGHSRRPRLRLNVVRAVAALDRGPLDRRRTGDARSVQSATGPISEAAGLASGECGRGAWWGGGDRLYAERAARRKSRQWQSACAVDEKSSKPVPPPEEERVRMLCILKPAFVN